jgi:hypothetical protein
MSNLKIVLVLIALAGFLVPTCQGKTPYSGMVSGFDAQADGDSAVLQVERAHTHVLLDLRLRTRLPVADPSSINVRMPGADSVIVIATGGSRGWRVRISGPRGAPVAAWRSGVPIVLGARGAGGVEVVGWEFRADGGMDNRTRRAVRALWQAGFVGVFLLTGVGVVLNTLKGGGAPGRYDPGEMLKPYVRQIVEAAIAAVPDDSQEIRKALQALVLDGMPEADALALAFPNVPADQLRLKLFAVNRAFAKGMNDLVEGHQAGD